MDGLKREIVRLQKALLEYDRALRWRECPWRAQFLKHREWDQRILAGLMQQLYLGRAV
jgi:hypothetical protein